MDMSLETMGEVRVIDESLVCTTNTFKDCALRRDNTFEIHSNCVAVLCNCNACTYSGVPTCQLKISPVIVPTLGVAVVNQCKFH